MAKLTNKDINALVKAATKNLADLIEEQAISKIGSSDTIEFDINVSMGIDATRSESYADAEKCVYVCFTIGGDRICLIFCY